MDEQASSRRSRSFSSASSSVSNLSKDRSRSNSKKRNFRNKKKQTKRVKHTVEFPSLDQQLINFEQFQELYVNNDIPTEKLRLLYQTYERKWENKQKELFFDQHKDEPWIQDKYNPVNRREFQEERNQLAQNRFNEFLKQYNMGGFNNINLTLSEIQLMELFELNDHFYNDDPDVPFWEFQLKESVDITKAPFFGCDPNQNSVFIKNVPLPLSRAEVVKALSQMNGYVSLTLSEPSKMQNYTRIGWVSFDGEEYCNNCVNDESITIKGHVLQFQKQQEKRKFVRIFKSVEYNKLLKDLQHQRELIKVLDKEKGISGNPLLEGPLKDRDDPTFNRQLDIQTLYLRRIHNYCYWSGAEFSDYRLLVSKVGYHFFRLDSKKKCNLEWQEIIQALCNRRREESNDELPLNELIDNEIILMGLKQGKTRQKDAFPCIFCEKQFQGGSYLIKHISSKHEKQYWEHQQSLRQQVIDQQMAANHKIERISKATIQRQIFVKGAIDELQLQETKVQLPINFAPRVQQRQYKDLDSIAQEKTQPAIMFQIRETKVNYNDI
ncbi:unnamed protein product [Paramecium sonneborni]|uniref:C2H2-type domain-containing protein n=1 Tax=Paramecium sonneborni TaxID=65129 RepID=A0A8S1RB70_9CILI|nr:unnamed protein product [Paramecium sonneborni]